MVLATKQGTEAAMNCSPDPAAKANSEEPGPLSVGKTTEKLESPPDDDSVNSTTTMETI